MLYGTFSRGTTPIHIFPIPKSLTMSDLKDFTITYRQKNKNVFIKHKSDIYSSDKFDQTKNIVVMLSQSDTLMFNPNINVVDVQIKAILNTNEVVKIGDYRLRLEDIFDYDEFEV